MLTRSKQCQRHDRGCVGPVDLSVHDMPVRDLALLPGSTTVFLQTLAWYLTDISVRCTELYP